MPDWQDEGFVLGARRFGESGIILSVLTQEHGRHLGLIHSRTMPMTASFVNVKWHARLSEHLGNYTAEQTTPFSARFMEDRHRLAAISTLCALLDELLPERENIADFYDYVCRFLENLESPDWQANYVRFEVELLRVLGFGLDLSECAGGGDCNDLAYVSPKTGRAVSREKGNPYQEKLLPLPRFLWMDAPASENDLCEGLRLTGYFLTQHMKSMPITRAKII